jgi:hypothetical protein
MPVGIVVDEQEGLILATADSLTTIGELVASFKGLAECPEFRPGMKILLDMTDYVHQATAQDVRRIAEELGRYSQRMPGQEVAVVVSKPVVYGMLRMLQALVGDLPFQLHVTYDREDAKRRLDIA